MVKLSDPAFENVFWLRLPEAPGMIFGCVINVNELGDLWQDAFPENSGADYVLALLNDKARPVATKPRQLALAQKKTDFVSNVSHDLKTPLTSIRMFAEMMEGGAVAGAWRNGARGFENGTVKSRAREE